MAVLRTSEVREMPKNELKAQLTELKTELMSERAKIASGGLPDNPGKIKELKKAIAIVYTIAGEKGYRIDD